MKDYQYAIAGTPCEPVIERTELVHIPDRVIELYPDDPDLPEVGAVSYMGAPLIDLDGSILGHLAILDHRPTPADPRIEAIFRVFAARAAAELRRMRAESDLLSRPAPATAGVRQGAVSRFTSPVLLLGLVVVFLIVLAVAKGPDIRAALISFHQGDHLYLVEDGRSLGTVVA